MGALTWIRMARAAGLSRQPEFPNLEALLEAESDQPHNDYRILARVAPPIVALLGCIFAVPLFLARSPFVILEIPAFGALAWGVWFLCDHLDRTIPRSRARIRQQCEQILKRYAALGSVVGIDPALTPSVGSAINDAAGIYLKHTADIRASRGLETAHGRAMAALEEGMAKMLELAAPQTAQAQEAELSRGWAPALLKEMQDLDKALDVQAKSQIHSQTGNDPLAALREARLELKMIESANDELEQKQT